MGDRIMTKRATIERQRTTIARARELRSAGRRAEAAAVLEERIRGGDWGRAALWSELQSLMTGPDDYAAIQELWLASPRSVHRNPAILRPVARAASIAEHHEEARALLRAAILARAAHRRSPRGVAGRMKRSVSRRVASRRSPPRSFEANAREALLELDELLAELDVRVFLVAGTVLGHVRSSSVIPWDKDIDVGVFREDVDIPRLEERVERAPRFNVRRLDLTTDRLRIDHVNGAKIDVFPHYLDVDGRVWHDGAATRWWNRPFELTQVEFLGVQQWIPDPAETYLTDSYGDWRTPDPTFDARLDAPNVEVTDQAYFDTLLYFGLLDAVTKRNRTKQERFARLLKELGEGDWVDRV